MSTGVIPSSPKRSCPVPSGRRYSSRGSGRGGVARAAGECSWLGGTGLSTGEGSPTLPCGAVRSRADRFTARVSPRARREGRANTPLSWRDVLLGDYYFRELGDGGRRLGDLELVTDALAGELVDGRSHQRDAGEAGAQSERPPTEVGDAVRCGQDDHSASDRHRGGGQENLDCLRNGQVCAPGVNEAVQQQAEPNRGGAGREAEREPTGRELRGGMRPNERAGHDERAGEADAGV